MKFRHNALSLGITLLSLTTTLQGCDHQVGPLGTSPPASRSTPPQKTNDPAGPSAGPLLPTPALSTTDSPADATPSGPARLQVHLVPIGAVPDDMLTQAAIGLRDHALVDPILEHAQDFPAHSSSSSKGRFRADVLLDWLCGLPIDRTGKVMGITEADITVRKGSIPDWGILGLGSMDGRCSLVSTYRMKRKWENGGAPHSLVRERLWKVAIHELGHTLGLEHCSVVGCIMEDGHGTVKTTDRDTDLCARCRERFLQALSRTVSADQ